MSKLVLDPKQRASVAELAEPALVQDGQGATVGYLLSEGQFHEMLAALKPPFTEAQLSLLKLQKAAKKITSILDLGLLVDSIVNDIACSFGCMEVDIFLRHESRDEMVAATMHCCATHGGGHTLKIGEQGMAVTEL